MPGNSKNVFRTACGWRRAGARAMWVWLFAITPALSQPTPASEPQPNPGLSVIEVVRVQMEALGASNTPHENGGIEIAFRFASPANKQMTGPLERFVTIVRGPVYAQMLDHSDVVYGPAFVEGDAAQVPVVVTGADGEQAGYVFRLSRQTAPPFANCWMTDGVVRMPLKPDQSGGDLQL